MADEITRPIAVIEAEINFYRGQTTTGIIEIGKRLIEAKAQLQYGEWGKWLDEKVDFTQRAANQFMKAALEFPDWKSISNVGSRKVFLLLSVPADEREEFIQSNPIEDMTTRELQKAIKEKKQAEEMSQRLADKVQELEHRPPQVVERTVVPADYEQAKSRFNALNQQLKAKESEIEALQMDLRHSKEGLVLKQKIDFLMKQKNDLSRQIESATELSKLTVRLHEILKVELAPIKFSRCMEQLESSETAVKNLTEIVNLVKEWVDEIETRLPNKNYIEVVEL